MSKQTLPLYPSTESMFGEFTTFLYPMMTHRMRQYVARRHEDVDVSHNGPADYYLEACDIIDYGEEDYEPESIITTVVKCKRCCEFFDNANHKSIVLACGREICRECYVDIIRTTREKQRKSFYCLFCNTHHFTHEQYVAQVRKEREKSILDLD